MRKRNTLPARLFAVVLALVWMAMSATRFAWAEDARSHLPDTTNDKNITLNEDQFLDLVSAYQGGYFQLAAVAAFQVYSVAGLIEGNFRAGYVDGPTALDLLGQNTLIHSVAFTTLANIHNLTPPDDQVAQGEMDRLAGILESEGKLLTALGDLFAHPGDDSAQAVDQARSVLEQGLESFAGEAVPPEPVESPSGSN